MRRLYQLISAFLLSQAGKKSSTSDNTNNNGKANYIETLKYFPSFKHDGKKLRCEVTHEAYSKVALENNENEADVVLKITCK